MTLFSKLHTKKGQMTDLILWGVIVFILIVTVLVVYRIITDVNAQFATNNAIPAAAKANLNNFQSRFGTIMDASVIFGILLLSALVIISTFLIESHPIFFVISLPIFIVVAIINAALANALNDFTNTSAFSSLYANMPMTSFMAHHWIALFVITGFVSLTVFYAKRVT